MTTPPESDQTITQILQDISRGRHEAVNQLMPLVYEDLKRIAERFLRQERTDHTLQTTALVNEAYLKLVDQRQVDWKGRTHFFAIGARAMRRILVDHAKQRDRIKRGGGRHRVDIDEALVISPQRDDDVLALDEALNKLAQFDSDQAQIIELRFFGGLTVQEVAEVLGWSKRRVEAEWTIVRAWLRRELTGSDDDPDSEAASETEPSPGEELS